MRGLLCFGFLATAHFCFGGNCLDGRPGTTIVFLNGILGDPVRAETSKLVLKTQVYKALQGTLKEQACLSFKVAYNPSAGFWSDLWEAARQRLGEDGATILLKQIVSGEASMPDWMVQKITSYSQAELRELTIPDSARPVVDQHVKLLYEPELADGNAVIVVAHSQGNLFANEEFNQLQQRGTLVAERFKIISVATPDTYVAGGGPYTTLCSDFIWRILGALRFNVNNNIALCSSALPSVIFWQHSFDDFYLHFQVSRDQILNQILDAIHVRVAGTGTVNVAATLDGSPVSTSSPRYEATCGKAIVSGAGTGAIIQNMPSGTCTVTFLGSAPPNSTLSGISPCVGPIIPPFASCAVPLTADQQLTFTLRFATNIVNQTPTAGFLMKAQGRNAYGRSDALGDTLSLRVQHGATEIVNFDGTSCVNCNPPQPGSSDLDGTISAFEWTSNGTRLPNSTFSGGAMQFAFGAGTHNISLVVVDNMGARSVPAKATIVVLEASSEVFTLTGTMFSGRDFHRAVLLNSGQVLVTGGRGGSSQAIDGAEVFNPASGTWRITTTTMKYPRFRHTATKLLDGRVLVAGGSDTTIVSEIYDPSTDSFQITGSIAAARNGHEAVLLNDGRVFTIGGNESRQIEIYNPASGTWGDAGIYPGSASRGMSLVRVPDGSLLVLGGNSAASGAPIREVYRYTPGTNTWQRMADLSADRDTGHTATLLADGRVLVISPGNFEVYNPSAGTNGQASSVNGVAITRYHAATLLADGRVLVAGGLGDGVGPGSCLCEQGVIDAFLFNPATSSWSLTPSPMNKGRGLPTATRLPSGDVLIAGGLLYHSENLFTQFVVHATAELWH